MKKRFYSNGKLLLSGEYAILDGALGLAIPTTYGQSMHLGPSGSDLLEWNSYDLEDRLWFSAKFEPGSLALISSSHGPTADTLQRLLREAKRLNPSVLDRGILLETHLDFPRGWGLGSSSTLINNLAQWAGIDPYTLLWKVSDGSGYDIACAGQDTPITYRLEQGVPQVEPVRFDPGFKHALHFVHLNQKQNSREAVAAYGKRTFDREALIGEIDSITQAMLSATDLDGFGAQMERHEALMSQVLGLPPVKAELFGDYPGAIKSLGAWGGDFILATGDHRTREYFEAKGYGTVIPFSKMRLAK